GGVGEGDGDTGFPNAISADGRYVAFMSRAANLVLPDVNGDGDVYVYDRQTLVTERVDVSSTGVQLTPSVENIYMTPDARFVTFLSKVSDSPGDLDIADDVFVRDRIAGTTERISVGTGGVELPGEVFGFEWNISDDGRYVIFDSTDSNGVVPGDTNGLDDIFLHDRQTGATQLVSLTAADA